MRSSTSLIWRVECFAGAAPAETAVWLANFTLIEDRAWFVDNILQQAWDQFDWSEDADIALLAVGGYGRGDDGATLPGHAPPLRAG